MSSLGIPVIESLQPELDVTEAREFTVSNGGMTITRQIFPAQNPNSSTIVVQCFPPSPDTLIDPCIWAQVGFELTFTGDNSVPLAPVLNIGATDAPRQWPLHQSSNNMDLRINGFSYNTSPQQWFPMASRLGVFQKDLNTWSSAAPSQPDTFQEYFDAANPNQPTSLRNPLLDYNGGTAWSLARGAHPVDVISNTGAGAVVRFTSTERLMVSPLFPNEGGLTGVSTMTFAVTLSNLNRVWSHGADPARSQVTGLNVTITSFELHVRFITPKPSFLAPSRLVLPYLEYDYANTSSQVIAPGGSGTFTNTSINLSAMPEKIYVMVKRQDADQFQSPLSYLYTDTCARINSCTINFANTSGLLASYSTQDLFHMSSENGLNLPYPDWAGSANPLGQLVGAGSFLVIDVARDLGTAVDAAPGSNSMPNFNITVNATNFGSQAKTFQLTVIIKYVGVAIIEHNAASKTITPLLPSDVLAAAENPNKEIHDLDRVMLGGKWYHKLGKALAKANKFLRRTNLISGVGEMLAPGNPYVEAAKTLGYGVQRVSASGGRVTSRGGMRVY